MPNKEEDILKEFKELRDRLEKLEKERELMPQPYYPPQPCYPTYPCSPSYHNCLNCPYRNINYQQPYYTWQPNTNGTGGNPCQPT